MSARTRARRSNGRAHTPSGLPHACAPPPSGALTTALTAPRFAVLPLRSFFGGQQEAGYDRFRTTSQNYYSYDTAALAVGESNQGIVSEKSKWIHAKQTM